MNRAPRTLVAGCAFLCGSAATAQTPRVEIEFDLDNSVVVAGGLIEIPPAGAIDSGSFLLSVPATPEGDVLPGPVEISDLSFSLTTDASPFLATLAGPFAVVQQGIAAGTLSDTLDEVVLSSPLFLDRSGTISCSGLFCWLFADAFPLVLAGVESIPAPATLQVAALNEPGSATVSETLAVTMNSGTAIFRMQGQEERRTFLPEPGTTEMITAGCLALALLERRRRPAKGVQFPVVPARIGRARRAAARRGRA